MRSANSPPALPKQLHRAGGEKVVNISLLPYHISTWRELKEIAEERGNSGNDYSFGKRLFHFDLRKCQGAKLCFTVFFVSSWLFLLRKSIHKEHNLIFSSQWSNELCSLFVIDN